MGHRLALVGVVGVIILDGSSIDDTIGAKREQTLVPVDVTCKVSVDAVFEHQAFKGVADVFLVRGCLTAVHGTMTVDEDPRSLGAVDGSQVLGQPLVLLVSCVVFPAVVVDTTKGTAVGDKSLSFGRQSLVALDVADERPFRTVGIVRLGIDANEVSEAIVEGVPEVANATTLVSGHAETVLEGCEVSET